MLSIGPCWGFVIWVCGVGIDLSWVSSRSGFGGGRSCVFL